MDRITFIHEYLDTEKSFERAAIINALVGCLSPQEACLAVDVTIRTDHLVQKSLQRKINRDVLSQGFQDCHDELIMSLIVQFDMLSYERKQGCANWLRSLYSCSTPYHQHEILHFLVSSKHRPIHNQAYRILKDHWKEEYVELLVRTWNTFYDELCAILIIDKCSISLLVSELDNLETVLSTSPRIAKLFIKIGITHPELLDRLKGQDLITYVYVLVKLNIKFNDEEAIEVFDKCKTDRRIGLLIWCFGQMGLWNAISHAANLSEEQIVEIYRAQLGIIRSESA